MKVLGVYNLKGGVGKTAAAVNLSYLAAAGGQRALLWDMDPQGAASYYLRVDARTPGGVDRLLGVTQEGGIFEFGRNAFNESELTGATFSPDGSTLFVGLQPRRPAPCPIDDEAPGADGLG